MPESNNGTLENVITGFVGNGRAYIKINEISDRFLSGKYGISERQVWFRDDLYGEKRSLSIRIRNRLNDLVKEGKLERHSRRCWRCVSGSNSQGFETKFKGL